jgi:hypothetical protein
MQRLGATPNKNKQSTQRQYSEVLGIIYSIGSLSSYISPKDSLLSTLRICIDTETLRAHMRDGHESREQGNQCQ